MLVCRICNQYKLCTARRVSTRHASNCMSTPPYRHMLSPLHSATSIQHAGVMVHIQTSTKGNCAAETCTLITQESGSKESMASSRRQECRATMELVETRSERAGRPGRAVTNQSNNCCVDRFRPARSLGGICRITASVRAPQDAHCADHVQDRYAHRWDR